MGAGNFALEVYTLSLPFMPSVLTPAVPASCCITARISHTVRVLSKR